MVENLRFGDLDVKSLINRFKGKRIEELFPNNRTIKNSFGQFLEFVWSEPKISESLDLNSIQNDLQSRLRIVDNIGVKIENRLHRRGINSLKELKWDKQYYGAASHLLELINEKNYLLLGKNRSIYDLDLSFCFNLSDFLFLDIETLGLYNEPIILVGLGSYGEESFKIQLLFAKNIDEEMAILEYLRKVVFSKYRCFITYNGKSFDIPFLVNRFLYFFEENPFISSGEDSSRENSSGLINTRFHHIDLLHCCRRKYKDRLLKFTLTNVEKHILNMERDCDLPGYLIFDAYRLYQEDRKQYVGLIKHLIEHNFFDVYSMPMIFEKLLI